MKEYHKIQTVYLRDPENKFKTLLEGQFALPEFEYLKNTLWTCTEKIDGTNIRIMWDGKECKIGGKTDNAQIPVFLYDKLIEHLFEPKMRVTFGETEVCLYGEGYGAKIQKGGGNYISDGVDFCLFDVKVGDWWLKREDVEDIAKKFDIGFAPVIGNWVLHEMIDHVKQGFKSQWGDFQAEGIVARPSIELFSRNGSRIITKIKCKDFRD